jgi:hypothetical protein
MGKGSGSTNTVTQNSAPPQAYQNAYAVANQNAAAAAALPYNQYPGQLVANQSPDQTAAYQTIANAQGTATPFLNTASQLSAQAANTGSQYSAQAANTANSAGQASLAAASPYNQAAASYLSQGASPISSTAIQGYENPYTQSVVNASTAEIGQQNAQQQQQVLGNAIAQGALGGDRVGLAQSALANQQDLAENQTIAGLNQSNYNQALAAAQSDATRQIQSGSMFSTLGSNVGSQYLQAGQAASNADLQAGQLGANTSLQAGNQIGNIGASAQSNLLSGASAQLQAGQLQQQQQQNQINAAYQQYTQAQQYPFQDAQYYANIAEGLGTASGGTSSTTSPGPSTASQVAGLGLTGIGAYGLASNSGLTSGLGSLFGSGASTGAGWDALTTAGTTAADSGGVAAGASAAWDALATLAARGGRVKRAFGGMTGWSPNQSQQQPSAAQSYQSQLRAFDPFENGLYAAATGQASPTQSMSQPAMQSSGQQQNPFGISFSQNSPSPQISAPQVGYTPNNQWQGASYQTPQLSFPNSGWAFNGNLPNSTSSIAYNRGGRLGFDVGGAATNAGATESLPFQQQSGLALLPNIYSYIPTGQTNRGAGPPHAPQQTQSVNPNPLSTVAPGLSMLKSILAPSSQQPAPISQQGPVGSNWDTQTESYRGGRVRRDAGGATPDGSALSEPQFEAMLAAQQNTMTPSDLAGLGNMPVVARENMPGLLPPTATPITAAAVGDMKGGQNMPAINQGHVARGITNNNPLNLKTAPGQGTVGSDGQFGQYATPEDGIAAAARQLALNQSRGLTTPRQLITDPVHGWAPASDGNNSESYMRTLALNGIDPDKPIDVTDPSQAGRLIASMGLQEVGQHLDPTTVQRGVMLGLSGAPMGNQPSKVYAQNGNYANDASAPSADFAPLVDAQGLGKLQAPQIQYQGPQQGVSGLDMSSPWMAVLQAGLATMGGTNPHALTNIGQGGLAGLSYAAQQQKYQQEIAAQRNQIAVQNADLQNRTAIANQQGTVAKVNADLEGKRLAQQALQQNREYGLQNQEFGLKSAIAQPQITLGTARANILTGQPTQQSFSQSAAPQTSNDGYIDVSGGNVATAPSSAPPSQNSQGSGIMLPPLSLANGNIQLPAQSPYDRQASLTQAMNDPKVALVPEFKPGIEAALNQVSEGIKAGKFVQPGGVLAVPGAQQTEASQQFQNQLAEGQGKQANDIVQAATMAGQVHQRVQELQEAAQGFRPGATGQLRQEASARLLDAYQAVGATPPAWVQQMATNADVIGKIGGNMTADLVRSLGTREAAAVYNQVQKFNPNVDMTSGGFDTVLRSIDQGAYRSEALRDFQDKWLQSHSNTTGMQAAFDKEQPPAMYASRVMPSKATSRDPNAYKNGYYYTLPDGSTAMWTGSAFRPVTQ